MKSTVMTLAAVALCFGITSAASAQQPQNKSTLKQFEYRDARGQAGRFIRAAQDGNWREYRLVRGQWQGVHTFQLIADDGARVVLYDPTRRALIVIAGNMVYVSKPNVGGGAPMLKYRGQWLRPSPQPSRPITY